MSVSAGSAAVSGWALDPDTAASIPVHVYLDGTLTAGTASLARSDIAAAYPGYGAAHGYSVTVSGAPGTHTLCVYGIEIAGTGANSLRGCRVVTIP